MFSITTMMVAVVVGVLTGEFLTDPVRAAHFSGMAATVVAVVLGLRVWVTAWRTRELLVVLTVPSIWFANISYTLNVADPAVDIMFDIATTLIMFVFYRHVHEHLLLSNKPCAKPRRRKEDIAFCQECTRPCGKDAPK
jgi:hypothetical protein